jgi:hypothetical protein
MLNDNRCTKLFNIYTTSIKLSFIPLWKVKWGFFVFVKRIEAVGASQNEARISANSAVVELTY